MEVINDVSILGGSFTVLAFAVNIIVQLTKDIITIPTKLWCVIVSMCVSLSALCFCEMKCSMGSILFSLFASFAVAYVAMYGFDTFKELWKRFKRGENINENN